MPYISKEKRCELDSFIQELSEKAQSPGDLNYIITLLIHNYIKKVGLNYTNLNSAIGVLESAKLEFYRQVVSPYENKKINENGNVSELDQR